MYHVLKYSITLLVLHVVICLPIYIQAQSDSTALYKKLFTQAEGYLAQKKYDKAIEYYSKLNLQFPNEIKPILRLAEIFYQKKDKCQYEYYPVYQHVLIFFLS